MIALSSLPYRVNSPPFAEEIKTSQDVLIRNLSEISQRSYFVRRWPKVLNRLYSLTLSPYRFIQEVRERERRRHTERERERESSCWIIGADSLLLCDFCSFPSGVKVRSLSLSLYFSLSLSLSLSSYSYSLCILSLIICELLTILICLLSFSPLPPLFQGRTNTSVIDRFAVDRSNRSHAFLIGRAWAVIAYFRKEYVRHTIMKF